MSSEETKKQLIEIEKTTLAAYKDQDETVFTKNFAADYIGIANDGMQTAATEVKKMKKFDLTELHLEDEKVSFPAENTAIITYKMVSKGSFDGKEISAEVYTSTVYINRGGKWSAVLHTESIAQ